MVDECARSSASSGSARCTSTTPRRPLGSNVDRHAPLGKGELGSDGLRAFLSEPRFDGLPAIFEGPGVDGQGAGQARRLDAQRLRPRGVKARGGG